MKVGFNGLERQFSRIGPRIREATARVLESGLYVGGPEVGAFEDAFAAFIGARHAIAVASGTDAISLGLAAAGVRAGDEVILPATSAYPTVVGVVRAGAAPVFVDVTPEGQIDPSLVPAAVGPRTRGLLPVHLYGLACDVVHLNSMAKASALVMVEDCAQAHGTRIQERSVGTFGEAGAWSFYPTKNLGAYGDGGAVTTNDDALADRLRRLRNYGQTNRYEHVEIGWNSRLDPIQAAVLGVKLKLLESENVSRAHLAEFLDSAIGGLEHIRPLRSSEGTRPSRHLYPVAVTRPEFREPLRGHLARAGIETLVHYPIALMDQVASSPTWRTVGRCHVARNLCATVVSLPMHPYLELAEVEHIATAVRSWNPPSRPEP